MSLGETLRKAREERGLSIADVAKSTHLMSRQIEALENEDFSGIAAAIYGKGFIKLYAENVGLDPAPLCAEFMEIYSGNRPPVIARRTIPRTSPVQRPVTRPIPRQAVQELSAPATTPVETPPPTMAPAPTAETPAPIASAHTTAEPVDEIATSTSAAPQETPAPTESLLNSEPSLGELFDAATTRRQAPTAPAAAPAPTAPAAMPPQRQRTPVTQPATTTRPTSTPQQPIRRRNPSYVPQTTATNLQVGTNHQTVRDDTADVIEKKTQKKPFSPANFFAQKWTIVGLAIIIAALVIAGAIVSSQTRHPKAPTPHAATTEVPQTTIPATPYPPSDSEMAPPGLNERVVAPPSPYME